MQISTEYGVNCVVLAMSVGLATIEVCIFCAVASVAALFYLRGMLVKNSDLLHTSKKSKYKEKRK